jgi:hypothetical protein
MNIVGVGCWYEIQEGKKFRYGVPAYTGPFRAVRRSLSVAAQFIEKFSSLILYFEYL